MTWRTIAAPQLEALLRHASLGERAKREIRVELNRRAGIVDAAKPPFPGRVEITVPWTALASDNLRRGVIGKESRAKQARYADALSCFRRHVDEQYSGKPADCAVRIVATVYVPDRKRRDLTNFAKLVLDGLTKRVITDDKFEIVNEATFRLGGIDPDRPRGEIVVEAIQPER